MKKGFKGILNLGIVLGIFCFIGFFSGCGGEMAMAEAEAKNPSALIKTEMDIMPKKAVEPKKIVMIMTRLTGSPVPPARIRMGMDIEQPIATSHRTVTIPTHLSG